MKKNYYLILAIILFTSFSALSQEFPTVGEVYDYDIGDVFQYQEQGQAGGDFGGGGFSALVYSEVIDKHFSENLDTVYYSVFERSVGSSSENPEGYIDERIKDYQYNNLSFVINGDTIFENTDWYNGRIAVEREWSSGYQYRQQKQTIGCGLTYDEYNYNDPHEWSEYKKVMLYFKKGDEEWGEEQVVIGLDEKTKSSHFSIYPNPVQNQLNIKSDFNGEVQIRIYNSFGQLMDKTTNSSSSLAIDVDHYLSGMYIVHIVDSEGISIENRTFIKN